MLAAIDLFMLFEQTNDIISTSFASINPSMGLEFAYAELVYLRLGLGNFQNELQFDSTKELSFQPNFGIVFKRVDFKVNNLVYPSFMNVTNTSLNTTIENEFGVKVSTIEHLMGALFGLGIDNALIEIDNEEVPILDGSAKEFIEKIISSGLVAVSYTHLTLPTKA